MTKNVNLLIKGLSVCGLLIGTLTITNSFAQDEITHEGGPATKCTLDNASNGRCRKSETGTTCYSKGSGTACSGHTTVWR